MVPNGTVVIWSDVSDNHKTRWMEGARTMSDLTKVLRDAKWLNKPPEWALTDNVDK